MSSTAAIVPPIQTLTHDLHGDDSLGRISL
jgi:hypothetical protein